LSSIEDLHLDPKLEVYDLGIHPSTLENFAGCPKLAVQEEGTKASGEENMEKEGFDHKMVWISAFSFGLMESEMLHICHNCLQGGQELMP